MATIKSASITNRDAVPAVLSNGAITKGALLKATGVCALTSSNVTGDKMVFCSIPSNAVVSSVKVSCPAIGTTPTVNFGLSDTTANGAAAVSASYFKAADDIHTAALNKAEIVNGNVVTVANMEKRVWENLSLSSDPVKMYDVVGTLAANCDAAGSVCVEVYYSI